MKSRRGMLGVELDICHIITLACSGISWNCTEIAWLSIHQAASQGGLVFNVHPTDQIWTAWKSNGFQFHEIPRAPQWKSEPVSASERLNTSGLIKSKSRKKQVMMMNMSFTLQFHLAFSPGGFRWIQVVVPLNTFTLHEVCTQHFPQDFEETAKSSILGFAPTPHHPPPEFASSPLIDDLRG